MLLLLLPLLLPDAASQGSKGMLLQPSGHAGCRLRLPPPACACLCLRRAFVRIAQMLVRARPSARSDGAGGPAPSGTGVGCGEQIMKGNRPHQVSLGEGVATTCCSGGTAPFTAACRPSDPTLGGSLCWCTTLVGGSAQHVQPVGVTAIVFIFIFVYTSMSCLRFSGRFAMSHESLMHHYCSIVVTSLVPCLAKRHWSSTWPVWQAEQVG